MVCVCYGGSTIRIPYIADLRMYIQLKAGSQYDARSCVALRCVAQSYCKHAATQRNARVDQKPILVYALASRRNARRKTLRHIVNQP